MTKTDLCKEYRLKHPDMPTLKLSRIIYKDHNLSFKDVEQVRDVLRRIEGKTGNSKDKKTAMTKHSDIFRSEDRPKNPYKLPESDEDKYTPYVFPHHNKLGILSDIHLPYHNIEALSEALTVLKKEKVDAVLLNGDTIDCHQLSRFSKDPKKRDFKYELDTLSAFIDRLTDILNCKIYFKIGNHEARYEHFLYTKAHELAGIEDFQLSNLIKAREKGIEVISSNQYMKINSLNGIHGHEYFGAFSPVNIARGLYMRGKTSAFQGHNHQTSEHTETDMNGNITTTWSIGCLSELHPSYMPLNKWNHGYAWVEMDQNKVDYVFHNKRIYKGKTL
jgi:predicted phosphodiesterase